MRQSFTFLLFLLLSCLESKSQDTFSIVALDSTTRQIGSAGASCLDLFWAGIANPSFLTDILPDSGAINTQSYFIQANQDNARLRMRAGDTPSQIIAWLVANDAVSNPEFKQYGIVGFNGNQASAASHTGTSCLNYKNHITGSINGMYYAIQGNILKGQEILDSMESNFRNTNGSLACRIMAAMQGANVVGADSRCNSENTSSLFAFLQLALPTDIHGQPTINISLKTASGAGIEPIDSLQNLFNAVNGCGPLSTSSYISSSIFKSYPNPTRDKLYIEYKEPNMGNCTIHIYNIFGQKLQSQILLNGVNKIVINSLPPGIYLYSIHSGDKVVQRNKFVVEK